MKSMGYTLNALLLPHTPPKAGSGLWIALAFLALLPATAQGQVASNAARITWVNATQLENGAPIPATGPESIIQTRVVRGSCNADGSFGVVLETLNVPVTATSVLFEQIAAGTYCYRARHVQENLGLSGWSVTVSKVAVQPVSKPKPPSITIS